MAAKVDPVPLGVQMYDWSHGSVHRQVLSIVSMGLFKVIYRAVFFILLRNEPAVPVFTQDLLLIPALAPPNLRNSVPDFFLACIGTKHH
jgi:hypothetical protein